MNTVYQKSWPRAGRGRRTLILAGAIALSCRLLCAQQYTGSATVEVACRGLSEPDGMAVHPASGELYVAEAGAGRVSVVRNGSAVPVVERGWTVSPDFPRWAIKKSTPESYWLSPTLNRPVSLAFDANAHLYVLEGVSQGRLLEFIPNEQGAYTRAKVHPIAWLTKNFTWDTVRIASNGNLFVCGNVEDALHLHFGSVLMRDGQGDWWVVDYGPFINFCGIDLSANGGILLIGDKRYGGFSWWDVEFHVALGEIQATLKPDTYADAIAVLPDGAFALGIIPNENGRCKVTRVDPFSEASDVLVDGLEDIGGLCVPPGDNVIYVTDSKAGLLLRCVIPPEMISPQYLIEQTKVAREIREGYTPRETPGFLRDFLLTSGVFPTKAEEETAEKTETEKSARINWQDMTFSLKEFARNIPLIAGKVEFKPKDEGVVDPIQAIEFVMFFPGDVILKGAEATPSMTLFCSTRKSGKTEKTRRLFSGYALSRAGDTSEEAWSKESEKAALSVPISTVNMKKAPTGRTVDLVFLGLGMYDDYYLNLITGAENSGSLIVEDMDGNQELYDAQFVRIDESGKVFRNLIIAGFDPPEESDVNAIGWLNIGYSPVGSALSTGDRLKKFSSTEESVNTMIEAKTEEKKREMEQQLQKEETL